MTSLNDVGVGTLRAEIALANAGDTINFANNLGGRTITLASVLTINKNLTIDGTTTNGTITISGNNATRIFSVTTGTATIFNLNLDFGQVTGDNGGAILVATGATLNVATDTFYANKAFVNTNNQGGSGGAIENLGTLSVTASTFDRGSASVSGGAIDSEATGTQTLSVSGTTFEGLSATNGGAIYTTNDTTLTGDTFTNGDGRNSATQNGGAVAAIGATPGLTHLTVTTSTFESNSAASGGAIYSTDGYTSIATSLFDLNTAAAGGAIHFYILNEASPATSYDATLLINQDTFTSNSASTGGAVFVDVITTAGTVTSSITNSTFYQNAANFTTGGGVQISQSTTANGAAKALLINDTFFQNFASTHGGGLALQLAQGGTLTNTVAMTSLTVYKNTAGTDSGGLYGLAGQAGSISINNSIFDQNIVTAQNYMGPIDVTLSNNNVALKDLGWNLVGTSNAMMFSVLANDILNNNAGLSNTLAANNALPGFPQTLALLAGSPANRAGDNTLAGKPNPLNIDARGRTRQANKVSIGAYDPDAI